jgi:dynein light chain LC8-type/valacyclovir hydrolase
MSNQQKRKNPVQVFAEDVTDEDMEAITKIAQSAFQLPFSDFQESRVFTKIADFIRKKLNKQFGPDFNVIVGKSFGAFVTHKAKSYMFFSVIPGVFTLVWKS